MQLEGKRIIVTGGSRGIAAAVVRAFAREGARVASLDLRDDLGQQVAEKATQKGPGQVKYYHCDISSRAEVDKTFESVTKDFGGLDVLVNIAGVERGGPAEELKDEDLELVINVNLYGTVYTNQAAFKYLKENGGRIINFASGAGLTPYLKGASYSAAKGAVVSWTRTVAHEWGKYNITANSIAPVIMTDLFKPYRDRLSETEQQNLDNRLKEQIPIGGTLGDPDKDLAPVLVFLAGEGSRFVNGQIIPIDGGMLPTR